MGFLYLYGNLPHLPACIESLKIIYVIRHTFPGLHPMFEIDCLAHDMVAAAQHIAQQCSNIIVIHSIQHIFVGFSLTASTPKPLWRESLKNKTIVPFSARSTATVPNEPFTRGKTPMTSRAAKAFRQFTATDGHYCGQSVFLQVDPPSRRPLLRDGHVLTIRKQQHPYHHFFGIVPVDCVRLDSEPLPPSFDMSSATATTTTLQAGDFIAYLLPSLPPEKQHHVHIAHVDAIDCTQPCWVQLHNGHHDNILSSGDVAVRVWNRHQQAWSPAVWLSTLKPR